MNDVSAESAKDRFWIVISWIQFGFALLASSSAGLLILGLYDGGLGRRFFQTFQSLLLVGVIAVLGLTVLTYIFTGNLRLLPRDHRTKQAVSMFVITVVAGVLVMLSINEDRAERIEEESALQVSPELEYTDERLIVGGSRAGVWNLVTHNKTSRKVIYKKSDRGNSANLTQISVTVVDDILIAEVLWDADCLPDTKLTTNVTCSEDGDAAMTVHLLKPTDSKRPFDMNWSFSEGGFSVYAEFSRWPLDVLRQQDAIFKASGKTQPDLSTISSIGEIFRYGSED